MSTFLSSTERREYGLLNYVRQTSEESIFSGNTAFGIAGSYTVNKGLKKYRLKDEHGNEEEFERPIPKTVTDIQSLTVATRQSETPKTEERPCDERAIDETLSIPDRLDALREWIGANCHGAAQYIAEQLKIPELPSEWQRIVIYAAEDLRFEAPALRDDVAESLLQHALRLRMSTVSVDVPAVMSSIRRAGSMLRRSKVMKLLPLLEGGAAIDTRLVTLQTLSHIFLPIPPQKEHLKELLPLAERATTIAMKHWDRDVFRAGEISAIAIEATVLSAQLGAPQAEVCMKMANATNRRLLLRKLYHRLEEVQQYWQQHGLSDRNLDLILSQRYVQERHCGTQ